MSTAAYRVERITDAAEIIARLAVHEAAGAATAFQTSKWLDAVYRELAPALGARALGLAVLDATTGELAALLPLVVRRANGLEVATFPDFGVSDYAAPLLHVIPAKAGTQSSFDGSPQVDLGPGLRRDDGDGERDAHLWAAVKSALTGVDLVRLTSMPLMLGGKPNPLALVRGVMPARHSANRLVIATTLEEFLRSRGKKYRKEVERCFRLLEKEGATAFRRAETPEAIARAYEALETQQGRRRQAAGGDYVLDRPAYSHFYERVLREGVPGGTAHIFTLEANDAIVAVLMGLTQAGTFTLLRISNGGDRWHHLSPGRLIVVEAMRYFLARGVNTFDMGIGDYAFKRGFGIEPEPLVDLIAGLTWRGKASAALHRAKARVRQSPWLLALADRVRRRKG